MKAFKRAAAWLLALALTAVLLPPPAQAATNPADNVPVTGIALSTNYIVLEKGEKFMLTAEIRPSEATNKGVTWTNSGTTATITNDTNPLSKEITAGDTTGTTMFTVTTADGGYTAVCEVVVVEKAITDIKFEDNAPVALVGIGANQTLKVSVKPDGTGGTQKFTEEFRWRSDNQQVVTVTQKDKDNPTECTVTAVGSGTTTVRAETLDGRIKAIRTVSVTVPVEDITLMSTASLTVGKTMNLTATVLPVTATEQGVTWTTSSDPGIAAVDDSGLVTALFPGTVTITATTKGTDKDGKTLQASCTLTVNAIPPDEVISVQEVVVNPAKLVVAEGNTDTLKATVLPGNATDKSVTWSSSDTEVATVSSSGVVTGVKEGTATITATSVDGGKTASCEVTVQAPDPSSEINILLSRQTVTLAKGGKETILATVSAPDGAVVKLTWTTADEKTATVADGTAANTGVITGVAPGETTVTVRAELVGSTAYRTAEIKVRVSGIALVEVLGGKEEVRDETDQNALNMIAATSRTLVRKAYGDAQNVDAGSWLWTSSDTSVAWVSPAGVVTSVGEGTALITCQSASGVYLQRVKVVVTRDTQVELTAVLSNGQASLQQVVGPLEAIVADRYKGDPDVNGLKYVTGLTVSPEQGTLYYNYVSAAAPGEGVASSEKYYANGSGKLLRNVSFVPNSIFSGTAEISYTAYVSTSKYFKGKILVSVSKGSAQQVRYTSESGEAVRFSGADFSRYCREMTGRELRYVTFTLPSENLGTLEYNHNDLSGSDHAVTARTEFYLSNVPRIDDVYFVPKAGWSGTATIYYIGRDVGGNSFTGSVLVTVKPAATDPLAGTEPLVYTTSKGQDLPFRPEDFKTVCRAATGRNLQYVTFPDLPASQKGDLWEGGSRVAAGTPYYVEARTGSNVRYLNNVIFRPNNSYAGSFLLPFTGCDEKGQTFTGSITILVGEGEGSWRVSYDTSGGAVNFRSTDFAAACATALSGSLSKVRLGQLDPYYGRLYVGYSSPSQNTAFTPDKDYTVSALNQLAFVPNAWYQGSVYIPYTATDRTGNTCYGDVEIYVSPYRGNGGFQDMGDYGWAARSVAFLKQYRITNGTSDTEYSPGLPISRGDYALMLSRMFSLGGGTEGYSDVPAGSYYAQAIANVRAAGLTGGGGRYRPEDPVTRQDAAEMLYRALKRVGEAPAAERSVLNVFNDSGKVGERYRTAMASLVAKRVFGGDDLGNLNPTGSLTRAEMAVILHRAVT